MLALKKKIRLSTKYDITIMQTPKFGEDKGYVPVIRVQIEASSHREAIHKVYSKFNVRDSIPANYEGRFINTGDILLFDEGIRGKNYYKLEPGGWNKIKRIMIK